MSQIRHDSLARLEPAAAGAIAAGAAATDAASAFPTHTLQALRAANLLGLVTPIAHGGLGGTPGDAAHVVERIARSCASSAMVTCMHYAGAWVIARHGTAETNRAIAEGRHLSTLAFSEAGSRSHFWAPDSTAVATPQGIRLDARKSWITSAQHADAYVWSSRPVTAAGASTIWLVPRKTAGLRIDRPFEGLGLRGNDSTPVTAEGAVVPEACRLGADGAGFELMMGTVLPIFQLMNAASSVGIMEGALTAAIAHVTNSRYPHLQNASLADLPTIRNQLARARVQADMARTLWSDSCEAVDAGRADAMMRVLEVKAGCGDAAIEVTQACMRMCGGAAFRKDIGVERFFRDAQAASVMAPTSDVLYDFLGKAACGLSLF